MYTFAMQKLTTIDLRFQGVPELIAAYAAPTGDGRFVLFESGPASTLGAVDEAVAEMGLDPEDLAAVFATHVHLDHSGGAGVLARRTGCDVYAHPAGIAHLIDPGAKLLPSAERLYGEMLEPLWGSTEGVPSRQLKTVGHGTEITIGDLEITGWHTPGHAVHHIAWQVGGDVVTGDVGGVRFPGADRACPPMPPPDIDIDAWCESVALIRDLSPERLLLTHYGAFDDAQRHLGDLEARIRQWAEIADQVVADGGSREDLRAVLDSLVEKELAAAGIPEETAERYRRLCPVAENSVGLHRWATKKAEE
jgi:glyoxylase-like metal-dependent hydrolase (beta-lactamase superfamily II)